MAAHHGAVKAAPLAPCAAPGADLRAGRRTSGATPGGAAAPCLAEGFALAARHHPRAAALAIDGREVTYAELAGDAARLARAIRRAGSSHRLVAVLAGRGRTACTAVLGILAAGRGYVPLNPRFPAARTRQMLQACGADVLIADAAAGALLPELLAEVRRPVTAICPETAAPPRLTGPHRAWGAESLPADGARLSVAPVRPQDAAYVMFTSGSTGRPKAVAVSQASVCAYLGFMCGHLGAGPGDRFSQNFELTFDLSVHDMFVCWWSGACLALAPRAPVIAAAALIRQQSLTVWFSVPSAIRTLDRLGVLKPGAFPALRWSLFCGEPLADADAACWQRAAPASIIENLYGPTEATIAITAQRWDPQDAGAGHRHGLVPIGLPFPGQRCLIVDDRLRPVEAGCGGELLLSGSQVASAYLDDDEQTRRCFVTLPGENGAIWYRSGDRVCAGEDGSLHFLGRLDHQVQVRGYRVELGEVEHVLREAAGGAAAVALPWPPETGRADEIHAFVAAEGADPAALLEACRSLLPSYMLPRRVYCVADLPRGDSGKIDRGALARRLRGLLRG